MATRRISLWILLVTVLAPCIEAGQNQPSASMDTTILSDTRGFDFGPYINQVVNRIRANWYMVIPEEARLGRKGRVALVFNIERDGKVGDLRVTETSGADSLDQASLAAVTTSSPFLKLPDGFSGDLVRLRLVFSYNVKNP